MPFPAVRAMLGSFSVASSPRREGCWCPWLSWALPASWSRPKLQVCLCRAVTMSCGGVVGRTRDLKLVHTRVPANCGCVTSHYIRNFKDGVKGRVLRCGLSWMVQVGPTSSRGSSGASRVNQSARAGAGKGRRCRTAGIAGRGQGRKIWARLGAGKGPGRILPWSRQKGPAHLPGC